MNKKKKPLWNYQYSAPTAGKRLLLLTPEELPIAAPLIKKTLKLKYDSDFIPLKFFRPLNQGEYSVKALELSRALRQFNSEIKAGTYKDNVEDEIHLELHIVSLVNMYCNQVFSDNGWKYIRKLISQAVKRAKSKTVYLDSNTFNLLSDYILIHKLDSPNEAISQLLIDSKVININFDDD
ncbi:hypothetical protein HNW13_017750 [Shewanella sp. BF02_Schw]|uniref:hypothetical protein n=1 Tax=Shewanella sp. BF02_Schw TaxID=394908 RepID=UPI0017801627|nr:hypothetical protein [Shewanella sp. BF02_Schw]MBO1897584.1 hypothetical protein [Shewanella sp. BF02_Schw]